MQHYPHLADCDGVVPECRYALRPPRRPAERRGPGASPMCATPPKPAQAATFHLSTLEETAAPPVVASSLRGPPAGRPQRPRALAAAPGWLGPRGPGRFFPVRRLVSGATASRSAHAT